MHTDLEGPSKALHERVASDATEGTFLIDARRSRVGFSVRHVTGRVRGTFMRVAGTVQYDSRRPQLTVVRVVICTDSIVTHNRTRDARLRSHGFFDVRRFPHISFASTSVRRAGRRLEVTGDLVIHGIARSITLTVGSVHVSDARDTQARDMNAVARAVLSRSDFGVGPSSVLDGGGPLIGDEIAIEMDLVLVRA